MKIKFPKKVRKISLRGLLRKADLVFSKWIRAREPKCVLCGSDKNLQAGHLIKRGKRVVRFDIVNVHTLCSGCNYKDNFEHDLYVSWFLKEYGEKTYQALIERSKELKKFSREELEKIIKKFTL